jgi:hypothetical protein
MPGSIGRWRRVADQAPRHVLRPHEPRPAAACLHWAPPRPELPPTRATRIELLSRGRRITFDEFPKTVRDMRRLVVRHIPPSFAIAVLVAATAGATACESPAPSTHPSSSARQVPASAAPVAAGRISAEQAQAALVELFRASPEGVLQVQVDLMLGAKVAVLDADRMMLGPWTCNLAKRHFGAVLTLSDGGGYLYDGEFSRDAKGAWTALITSKRHAQPAPRAFDKSFTETPSR